MYSSICIFFAAGPDINNNHQVAPFETVNYYLLMCRLLDLKPAPNNGTAAALEGIMTNRAPATKEQSKKWIFLLMILAWKLSPVSEARLIRTLL